MLPDEHAHAEAQRGETPSCSDFIRAHHAEILGCWESRIRSVPIARKLDRPRLLDHLPNVLNRIADCAEEVVTGRRRDTAGEGAELHPIERLDEGFDLTALVMELGILRSCIIEQMESAEIRVSVSEVRILDEVIDRTVNTSIECYTRARDRTLQTFDRIATVALESRSLDELIERLLQILVQTSAAIHNATILVRENNFLRVRASVGFNADAIVGFRLAVGDGFAGTIAAARTPMELHDAASDPLIRLPGLKDAGVRALYGIPFVEAGEVIAVAQIGSVSHDEFSIDDKRLLRAVAGRASSSIFQHVLRETAERTTAELRQREQELRQREQEFRALADNIPQLAWMADEHGHAYWYNQRWLDYTGVDLEEARRSGPARYHHPDHLPRVAAALRHSMISGQPFEETFPLRDKYGRFRWFLSRAIPIRDEHGAIVRWFGTNTDITNQRLLDEATKVLNSSLDYNNTLQRIAQLSVPDLADWCTVDLLEPDGQVRRMTRGDPSQAEAARAWNRKYPPTWEAPDGALQVIQTGEAMLFAEISDDQLVAAARNEEQLRALRDVRLKSCIIAPLQARGRTLGAITLVTAESQRTYDRFDLDLATELGRRAGLAVDNARLYEESQHALREREQAVRSRDEVLAIVSHDLRNPLNAIAMSRSLLAPDCSGPHSEKHLAVLQRSTERMAHMIDDLLDMATIQAKGLTLHHTSEDATALVASVFDAHQPKAASAGIELRREDEVPGVKVTCDRDRIERVFANLVGNGLKYCRPGDAVAVRARIVDNEMWFSVADTGPGIPPDQLPHLFDAYFTAMRTGTKEGTGLGLYIAKGIVDAHGGRMWVESTVSKGTEFFFTLPLATS